MSNSKRLTWRDGLIAAAASARTRARNAEASHTMTRNKGEDAHAALHLRWLADELAYIASQPPHEGAEAMRKLGDRAGRKWAEATAAGQPSASVDAIEHEWLEADKNDRERTAAAYRADEAAREAARQARAGAQPLTLDADEIALVNKHEIIEAIKTLRHRTGLGLTDAKRAIDHYRNGRSV
jgi:ribosomal protein L7/L12